MLLNVNLKNIESYDLFEQAINQKKRGNLFCDLRKLFKDKVLKTLEKSHVVESTGTDISKKVELFPLKSKYPPYTYLDLEFCMYYGTTDYSIEAVNYQHGDVYPCLKTFHDLPYYSIGNFEFQLSKGSYEIEVLLSESIRMVGYSYETGNRKNKPYLRLYGVHFNKEYLSSIFEKYLHIIDYNHLEEIRIGTSSFPPIFMCRNTGKLFTCTCFKDYIYSWYWDFYRFTHGNHNPYDLNYNPYNIEFVEGICSICTGEKPKPIYQFSGISSFLKRYMPYYELYVRSKYNKDYISSTTTDGRKIENEVRAFFKYPLIGEKWKSETLLYKNICLLFPNINVIFHYRGKEMNGLEIDIFLPSIKLGIEYQGEQHFNPIACWGGEEGFKKTLLHDEHKKNLCKNYNYKLIYFTYKDSLSIEHIKKKLNQEGYTIKTNL